MNPQALTSGKNRLYSRKKNPKTGQRRVHKAPRPMTPVTGRGCRPLTLTAFAGRQFSQSLINAYCSAAPQSN
jgi:hypothetical protein